MSPGCHSAAQPSSCQQEKATAQLALLLAAARQAVCCVLVVLSLNAPDLRALLATWFASVSLRKKGRFIVEERIYKHMRAFLPAVELSRV